MRAIERLEAVVLIPVAAVLLCLGIHMQHYPTGRVARAVEWFLERMHHES